MAIQEFWKNVWRTSNWMGLRIESAPEGDREGIEANLRGATYWLKPGWVWGFDPSEFDFLSDEERLRLTEGVGEFKKAAESVPKRGMPTVEDYKVGEAGLLKILEVVRPDKYQDFEAFVIGKKVERLIADEVPDWVREMTFKTDSDSIGEPALRVTVLAEDYALNDQVLRENTRLVDDILSRAAREVCPDRWPYLEFWTVSGQEDVGKAVNR
jgi:hypothetical protein